MIPQETVDKILDSAQIEDVVGDFVSLKRRGANFIACCPFHNEKTPSFYVSPAKGIFKCFGCGKSGTAVGFVMEHEGLTYVEALKYLARKYHIEVVEKEETAEEIANRQRSESLFLVMDFAGKFFRDCLKSETGRVGYAYFKTRGLEDSTIEKFGLGWAPVARTSLLEAARKAGYKEEFLIDTGLCYRRDDGKVVDRFYDRAMFPVHSPSGRIIAFGGRTLRSDKAVAKYVNSPETEIYVKSRSLYGIWLARNEIVRQDKCILVEGYFDVISMYQLGIRNIVASSGTSLTVEQIRLIRKYSQNVTIIYDGDSAGIKAALRGIGLVLKEGLNVKVVLLPDGDDPDSFSRKHTLEEVQSFLDAHEQDFIGFKSDILLSEAGDDPLKKANLINDIADTIAMIPDPVKRSVYADSCSTKFGIEARILFERIRRSREDMLAEEKRQEETRRRREELASGLEQDGQVQGDGQTHGGPGQEGRPAGSISPVPPSGQGTVRLEDPLLAPCEKELLGFILEHGQEPLEFDRDSEFYIPDDRPDTVAEFIDNSLSSDDVSFSNTPYRKVYELYFSMYDEGLTQTQIQSRIMNSEDPEVAAVAQDILVDKYMLTVENYRRALTSVATQLIIFVPKSLLAYQVKRLDKMYRELSRSLAAASDPEEQTRILSRMNAMNKARATINNKLGRV